MRGPLLQDPPWPWDLASSPCLALFPGPGSLQLGRGQSVHCPDTSQPTQAWPFLRQPARGLRTLDPTVTSWTAFPTSYPDSPTPAWILAQNTDQQKKLL